MAEPQVLEVRRAVRSDLTDMLDEQEAASGPPGVIVACSGGADSLALAAAVAHEARRLGIRAGGVSVDHGLQEGSADRARVVAAVLARLGLDPAEAVHVRVGRSPEGPEGSARRARYAALDNAAQRHAAAAVLLGHTLDDQAETVLLGLARGSGARSLAGMASRSGLYRRPLLRLPRGVVRYAVPAGVKPWEDPHNADDTYARVRVRHRVLPVLERELGPGVAAALARTADLLRADADALDEQAASAGGGAKAGDGYDVATLATLPRAIRWRVLRSAAIAAGCSSTDLTAAHVEAVDALIVRWHGQKGVDLPSAIRALRRDGILVFRR